MFSQRITMMRQQFFILLASMVVVLSGTIAYFAYHNLTYDRARTRQIRHAGFVEKQTVLPDKSVINYGEGPNNGIPLLLIHGQQVSWQDYSQVLTELSSRYHVFAVDCYGHGGSSKDPKKYTARANSDDIVWFINNVVKDQVVVSGHSSGGLIATLVAATAPDMIRGLVIEDAPFFSTEPDRAPKTFAGHGFKDMHDFLASGEPNFTRYSLEHTYLAHLFGEKNFDNLVRKPALKRLDRRPHEIPRVWYYPPGWKINEIYDLTANMQDGTGSYDLRFGDTFYDYSWFTGFDQVETLRAVTCPSVLLHVGPDAKIGSYYDDNGVLLSAMDDKDSQRVYSLLPEQHRMLIDNVDSGHDIHAEKPDIFIYAVDVLAEKWG